VYGWLWLRHPGLTRRARALALADTTLGLYGSLTAARTMVRTERRQAAIAALLRRKLAAGRDPLAAEIAVTVYDLDLIAGRLAAGADYDGLTALIGADLTPTRLAAVGDIPPVVPASVAAPQPASEPATPSATVADGNPPDGPPDGPPTPPPGRTVKAARPATGAASDTAKKVARWHARMPDATHAELAAKARVSVRSVERYRPAKDTATEPATTTTSEAGTQPANGAAVPDLIDTD
jgi:hypothetical protein